MTNDMIEAATEAVRKAKFCDPDSDPCDWCDKPDGCRSIAVDALYAAEMIEHSAIMDILQKKSLPDPSPVSPTTPPAQGVNAIKEIAAERKRQMEVEGWSEVHDDAHRNGSLACAGAAYALAGSYNDYDRKHRNFLGEWWGGRHSPVRELWPGDWGWEWFKPKDRRRDLVRAAALIVAEIERLDRAAQSKANQ